VSGFGFPGLGDRSCWADIWVRSGWRVREHVWSGAVQLLDPNDQIVFSGNAGDCLDVALRTAPHAHSRRAAVVMHGMGRSRRSMRHIAEHLTQSGFTVANLDYPSLFRPVEAHAEQALGVAHALVDDGADSVVFAGHSLGGLIGRMAMAEEWPGERRGRRAVLVGAPNRGALLADWLSHIPGYHQITGACGQSVRPNGAAQIPVPPVEIGVIAGGTGGFGFNPWLGEDNDGILRVTETRLNGAESGFRLVPALHAVMPRSREVIEATSAFLSGGKLGR
jgi:pimeloyl-ACP methyl ester carboxylesterase